MAVGSNKVPVGSNSDAIIIKKRDNIRGAIAICCPRTLKVTLEETSELMKGQ